MTHNNAYTSGRTLSEWLLHAVKETLIGILGGIMVLILTAVGVAVMLVPALLLEWLLTPIGLGQTGVVMGYIVSAFLIMSPVLLDGI